jgi:hypothetical protein
MPTFASAYAQLRPLGYCPPGVHGYGPDDEACNPGNDLAASSADAISREVQVACDDLFCAPLDCGAQTRLRDLLLRITPAAQEARTRARRIKIACEELHDDPTDLDARLAVLSVLGALDNKRVDDGPRWRFAGIRGRRRRKWTYALKRTG